MKHALPPLDSLKAFEAAARHLSFSLAADELCITKGAISYQIRKLETHVDCALFKRSTRQVYLTDAGQSLLQTTQRLFQELGNTVANLPGESRHSAVTIAATTYVAARWLSSRISNFNEHHPDISIRFHHSVNSADFKLAEVDLAIRWGPCRSSPDQNRLGELPMPLFPVVSPRLLERHGIDLTSSLDASCLLNSSLSHLPLLCEERHQDLWQEWFASTQSGSSTELANPRRIISDANVRVQAAIDGQGFILADGLMNNELEFGLLVAPFAEELTSYGYNFLVSPSRKTGANARLLTNWLQEQEGSL